MTAGRGEYNTGRCMQTALVRECVPAQARLRAHRGTAPPGTNKVFPVILIIRIKIE